MTAPTRRRSAVLTAFVVVLVGLALYAVAIWAAPPGRCPRGWEGRGLGCSPAPPAPHIPHPVGPALPMTVCMIVSCTMGIMALLRWTRLPGIVVGLIGTIGGALVSAVVTLGFLILV